MNVMRLFRFTRRSGQYAVGETAWFHPTVAEPMLRTGVIVPADEPPRIERQTPVETAMAAPAPEAAVTRRRGRWGKR